MFPPSAGSPLGTQPPWICLVFPFIPERLPRERKRAAQFLRLNYRVVSLPEVSEPPVPPELPPRTLVGVGGARRQDSGLGVWRHWDSGWYLWFRRLRRQDSGWAGWESWCRRNFRLVSVALPPEDVPYP